jgi:hypothetical protein
MYTPTFDRTHVHDRRQNRHIAAADKHRPWSELLHPPLFLFFCRSCWAALCGLDGHELHPLGGGAGTDRSIGAE